MTHLVALQELSLDFGCFGSQESFKYASEILTLGEVRLKYYTDFLVYRFAISPLTPFKAIFLRRYMYPAREETEMGCDDVHNFSSILECVFSLRGAFLVKTEYSEPGLSLGYPKFRPF